MPEDKRCANFSSMFSVQSGQEPGVGTAAAAAWRLFHSPPEFGVRLVGRTPSP
jgi:hypothetical protein